MLWQNNPSNSEISNRTVYVSSEHARSLQIHKQFKVVYGKQLGLGYVPFCKHSCINQR